MLHIPEPVPPAESVPPIPESLQPNSQIPPSNSGISLTNSGTPPTNSEIVSETESVEIPRNSRKFHLIPTDSGIELLRNGQTISIQELSNAISRRLEGFWITEKDNTKSKNTDLDTESDDETDSSIHNHLTYDNDSDEDIDLDDSHDIIQNVNISANRGIRLVDKVKEEFAQTYFQVMINGDKKYLHKQAACWLLQKDRSSLSSDRISRVRGE
ncbi:unnamed protein product [Rotaria sp. Silwood2]|nr:unnamed protein product [Rotaria sp. Silwood2]